MKREVGFWSDKYGPYRSPVVWRDPEAERKAAQEQEAAMKAAAEHGLWALADHLMPSDVREAAERWKLDHVMTEMWRSAFIAGWREAFKAERVK
jgi:hypothetical protein